MNLKNILQKISLKLEHHPRGNLVMLLVFPFYARPHHFRGQESTIIARIALFSPFVIAWIFAQYTTSSVFKLLERQYAATHIITAQAGQAFDRANSMALWIMLLGITLFIYIAATIVCSWDNLLCRFWRKFVTHQVRPAPFSFYIACWSSRIAWLWAMAHVALYVIENGIVRTQEVITQAFDNYPNAIFFLLLVIVVLQKIKERNMFSSAMEIFGSRKIVVINTALVTLLALLIMWLCETVPQFING